MGSDFNFKNFGNDPPVDGPPEGGRLPGNLLLTRLPSVYSLTFDEFQSTMEEIGFGKDFGSMNMDELMKNIWNAEELQAMGSSSSIPQESSISTSTGLLQKQGSLTLPRTLSLRTVDEVWRNMSKEFTNGTSSNVFKHPTLGEVTLEDFLFRAGVVREEAQLAVNPTSTSRIFGDLSFPPSNQALEFEFQQQPDSNSGLMENTTQITLEPYNLPLNINGVRSSQENFLTNQTQEPELGGEFGISDPIVNGNLNVVEGGGMGMVSLGGGGRGAVTVAVSRSPAPAPAVTAGDIGKSKGNSCYVTPVPYVFNGSLRGRRSGGVEKVVERRQRRMIKNRESAARSRARKQAYTTELEAEVAKLKEENKQLRKKQAELMLIQKNQLLEMKNKNHGVIKRRCIRRTQTGMW